MYDFDSEFEKNVDRVSDVGMECTILGDFNYDFTPSVHNTRCCNLLFFTLSNGFTQLILQLELQTIAVLLLIYFFVTNSNFYHDYGVFPSCISDHML